MTSTESILTNSESEPLSITIAGITQPTILRYFETMNASEFEETAALFAANGQLHPPFETPLEGSEAIVSYLKAEAQGMTLYPREGTTEVLEDGNSQIQVGGKVKTRWFIVNVSWLFILNAESKILSTTIKLLASPQELLKLRR